MEANYKISACYFPRSGEAELTYENLQTGEKCFLMVKVTPEEGDQLAEVVGACVYHGAREAK